MNPEVASLCKAACDLGLQALAAADTSWEYHFFGQVTDKELQTIVRLLVNKAIEYVITEQPHTLLISGLPVSTKQIPVRSMSAQELQTFAAKQQLFLDQDE